MGVLAKFKLESFDFGRDEDDDPITTAIVSTEQVDAGTTSTKARLTPTQKAALRALWETIADGNTAPVPADQHVPKSVTTGTSLSQWRVTLEKLSIINKEGNPREQFRRIHVTLKNLGLIGTWEGFVWPVT